MPSIASSKVTITTILSQRKTGPWKRKEQTVFYDRFQPLAGPARVKNAVRMRVFPASGAYLPLKLYAITKQTRFRPRN